MGGVSWGFEGGRSGKIKKWWSQVENPKMGHFKNAFLVRFGPKMAKNGLKSAGKSIRRSFLVLKICAESRARCKTILKNSKIGSAKMAKWGFFGVLGQKIENFRKKFLRFLGGSGRVFRCFWEVLGGFGWFKICFGMF